MRFPKIRFSMRQLMIVIAALALGLAICPRDKPYLGLLPLVAGWLGSLRSWLTVVYGILVVVFCALIEIVLSEPLPAWVYVSTAVMFSRKLWPERPILQHRDRLTALFAALVVLFVLYAMPWSSRKLFLERLYSIKPGMTKTMVNQIMARYMVETDFNGQDRLLFRHSNDEAFNSDWGVVTFGKGRVVDVNFLPD